MTARIETNARTIPLSLLFHSIPEIIPWIDMWKMKKSSGNSGNGSQPRGPIWLPGIVPVVRRFHDCPTLLGIPGPQVRKWPEILPIVASP